MRRLPNALSLLRIPLSAWMLSVRPFSAGFWAAYLLGGLTDGLDGFLARRLAAVSRRGAMLDSLADAAFFLALLIVLRGVFRPTWTRVWLAAVFAVRMACVITGLARFRTPGFLHTRFNRLAGGMLFCAPVILWLLGRAPATALILGAASVAALEELYILCTMREFQPDIRGFSRIRGGKRE